MSGADRFVFRAGRRLAAAALLPACLALAACGPQPGAVDVAGAFPSPAAGGLAAGDGLLAIPASPGQARRALLPNDTALPGENFVLTRPAGGLIGQPSLAQILQGAGPLPAPFEYATSRDFVPVGSGGGLAYVASAPAEGVTCVLAAGLVPPAGIAFGAPFGAGAYGGAQTSVVMRNCVRGDQGRALAPIASYGGL